MVTYKLNPLKIEYDILNLSHIRQNRDNYPRGDNNCGDELSMFLIDDGHLCDNIITGNKDIRSNNIM